MKQLKFIILFLSINVLAMAQYPSEKNILDKIDDNMSAKTRVMTVKMEIDGARGTRTMESKIWTEGDKRSFTEYLSPAREKGTKMLKLENQLWIYSPTTDRVMQISGHMLRQSVMGSDMSYEDMMNDTPLLERYRADVTGEETIDDRKCWVVTLTAIKEDVNYYSQKLWVDEERYVPLRMDLFAKSGKLLKRTTLSDIQKVQGRWFPKTMVYKDMLKEGNGTRMTFMSIQFNVSISESTFNKANLK
ncbi:MAG: outer membrane lipoprotein-sorting protein [Paludibacter sp.]|nr:outer membrane lipoprotein-sorting protein [Paludibacter sp.]